MYLNVLDFAKKKNTKRLRHETQCEKFRNIPVKNAIPTFDIEKQKLFDEKTRNILQRRETKGKHENTFQFHMLHDDCTTKIDCVFVENMFYKKNTKTDFYGELMFVWTQLSMAEEPYMPDNPETVRDGRSSFRYKKNV